MYTFVIISVMKSHEEVDHLEAYSGRRYRSCETPAELQRSAIDQDR
jgi:hypothetical protein